jgi:hypothetical protein
MPSVGFEHAILAVKWLQTYALDRTATGIGGPYSYCMQLRINLCIRALLFFRYSVIRMLARRYVNEQNVTTVEGIFKSVLQCQPGQKCSCR